MRRVSSGCVPTQFWRHPAALVLPQELSHMSADGKA
jgi:hypothetical protein